MGSLAQDSAAFAERERAESFWRAPNIETHCRSTRQQLSTYYQQLEKQKQPKTGTLPTRIGRR